MLEELLKRLLRSVLRSHSLNLLQSVLSASGPKWGVSGQPKGGPHEELYPTTAVGGFSNSPSLSPSLALVFPTGRHKKSRSS